MRARSDQELLKLAQAGDRRATEALLLRVQPQVLRFGMKMCRHPEDAQDVTQEALLSAARGLEQFRGGAAFSTWLYTIARSHCIKKNRRSKFAPEREYSLDEAGAHEVARMPAPGRDPEQATLGKELQLALSKAIEELDPMYREVLVLRDVQGLTAPEVAEVVGAKVGAVKSRLHRARAAVRTALAPLVEGSPAPTGQLNGCPNIVEMFSKHMEGEIDSDLCAVMQDHLSKCPRCQQQCDTLKQVLSVCKNTPAPAVPLELQARVKHELRRLWVTP